MRQDALELAGAAKYASAYSLAYGARWGDGLLESRIPPRMHGGIVRYMLFGVMPGNFLTAIFSNDLMGALRAADDENVRLLWLYGNFLHNYAEPNSFGSVGSVKAWSLKGGVYGAPK